MIPHLLVLFTQQLEILVTTLPIHFPLLLGCMIMSLKQIKCKLTKDKIELNLCRFDQTLLLLIFVSLFKCYDKIL